MRILVIEVDAKLSEESAEKMRESIRKDIKRDGFILLDKKFKSYIADVDGASIKTEIYDHKYNAEPKPIYTTPSSDYMVGGGGGNNTLEIKGCRFSACKNYCGKFPVDLETFNVTESCLYGDMVAGVNFNTVCPLFR